MILNIPTTTRKKLFGNLRRGGGAAIMVPARREGTKIRPSNFAKWL